MYKGLYVFKHDIKLVKISLQAHKTPVKIT